MTLRRGRRLLVAAALALAALPSGAVAAAPARATGAVLTTGTRIEWTGVKGFRLTVPKEGVTLPPYAALLRLRGGTYAGVRWTYGGGCDGKQCTGVSAHLDYTHGLARHFFEGARPGTDHLAHVTNERRLAGGVWDVYLFTDGAATLEFDATSLPRRARAWTATGRVRGTFMPLPTTCAYAQCTARDGYGGRARVGGATGDTGRRGIADGFVANYGTTPMWVPQAHGVRGCAYAEGPGHTGVAATDHPLGCDAVEGGGQSTWPYEYAAFAAPVHYGAVRGMGLHDARGRVYLGFMVSTAHDLSRSKFEAYGLWWEYGIR